MTSSWRHYDVIMTFHGPISIQTENATKTIKITPFGQMTPRFSCSWTKNDEFRHLIHLRGLKHHFSLKNPPESSTLWKLREIADFSKFYDVIHPKYCSVWHVFRLLHSLATKWGVKLQNPNKGYDMVQVLLELVFSPRFHQNPPTGAVKCDDVIKLVTSQYIF